MSSTTLTNQICVKSGGDFHDDNNNVKVTYFVNTWEKYNTGPEYYFTWYNQIPTVKPYHAIN